MSIYEPLTAEELQELREDYATEGVDSPEQALIRRLLVTIDEARTIANNELAVSSIGLVATKALENRVAALEAERDEALASCAFWKERAELYGGGLT